MLRNIIKIVKIFFESFFVSKPIEELRINVRKKVSIIAPPLRIPITWAYPIGKANSQPRS